MKIALTFAATSALTLFAFGASAECDPACPEGFVCEEFPTECTTIDVYCPEGEDCEVPECEPTIDYACTPAPCTTDDDCGPDLICMENETLVCIDTDCAPGADCEIEAPQCEPEIERLCAPRWLAPCETAADCGEGFDCVEEEMCSCSGSSSARDPDEDGEDSETPPADEPECSCEPTGEMICEAQEIDCGSDEDACPGGWTCIDNPNGVCTASTDGSTECFTDGPERLCAPPYQDLIAGGAGYGVLASDQGVAANGEPTAWDGSGDEAETTAPARAADDSGESGGGCSLAVGGAPASGWLVSLLALVPLARRRRRR